MRRAFEFFTALPASSEYLRAIVMVSSTLRPAMHGLEGGGVILYGRKL